jgi:hypothetical protein
MSLRIVVCWCLFALVVVVAPPARADAGADIVDTVDVRVKPRTTSIRLGENFDLKVTVTNKAKRPSPPLVVQIDITNPGSSLPVDPEDWTDPLSKTVGVVAPGKSVTLHWTLQPISNGTYAAYAVALSPGKDSAATSNIASVNVTGGRTLNSGGIGFVAVGMPALVGGLLLLRLLDSRRTRPGGAK